MKSKRVVADESDEEENIFSKFNKSSSIIPPSVSTNNHVNINYNAWIKSESLTSSSHGSSIATKLKRLSIHEQQQQLETTNSSVSHIGQPQVDASQQLSVNANNNYQQSTIKLESEKDRKKRYNTLIRAARDLEKKKEHPSLFLHMYEEAYSLFSVDSKLLGKIQKYKSMLGDNNSQHRPSSTSYATSNNVDTATLNPEENSSITNIAPNVMGNNILQNLNKGIASPHPTNIANTEIESSFIDSSVMQSPQSGRVKKRFKKLDNGFIFDTKADIYLLMDQKAKQERRIPFKIPASIYDKLYDYQREAILWYWNKHKSIQNKIQGGILADDMGLGKTATTIAFISGLFAGNSVKYVMIAMPVSLIENWRKEFTKWSEGDFNIFIFHSLAKKQRLDILSQFREEGGVLLTTYGTISSQIKLFVEQFVDKKYEFDYIFLDEGHKLKNPNTLLSKCLHQLPTTMCRYVISGTPVQNNLLEMHALLDWIFKGSLLGNRATFKEEFEKKILRANEKDATSFEKKLGIEILKRFRELIGPHLLRREKSQVLGINPQEQATNSNSTRASLTSSTLSSSILSQQEKRIGKKNDLVVWIKSTDYQLQLYRDFLKSDDVNDVINRSTSPLAAITILKQICSHPDLLPNNERKSMSIQEMISMSGKMMFLKSLVEQLYKEKEKCLIFSQSTKMLDMIASMLKFIKISYTRIDGSINSPKERQRRVDAYNASNSPYFCFLLTSQTGSVGLTLTAATRVIIFDPSWNPCNDNQAADRCYRIGQLKDVVIYRLISCSTIEEKVYRKQVFKDALFRSTTTEKENQYRYFTHSELRELFSLPQNPNVSETQLQLESIHKAANNHYSEKLKQHVETVKRQNKHIITGFSNHDLLYSKQADDVQYGADDEIQISLLADDSTRALYDDSSSKLSSKSAAIPTKNHRSKHRTLFDDEARPSSSKDWNSTKVAGRSPPPSEFSIPSSEKENIYSNSSRNDLILHRMNTTKLTNEQCKQLIKGVRIYGENGNWKQILQDFFLSKENQAINTQLYVKSSFTPLQLEKEWQNFKIGKSQQELHELVTLFDSELDPLVQPSHDIPKIKPNNNNNTLGLRNPLTDSKRTKTISNHGKIFSTPPSNLRNKKWPKTIELDEEEGYELSPSPTTTMNDNHQDDDDDCMLMSPSLSPPIIPKSMSMNETSDDTVGDDKSTAPSSFEKIQRRLSSFFGLIDEEDENYEPSDDEEERVLDAVKAVEDSKTCTSLNTNQDGSSADDEYPIYRDDNEQYNTKSLYMDDIAEDDEDDEYEDDEENADEDDEGFICDEDEDDIEYDNEDNDPTMQITPLKPPINDRDEMLFSPTTTTYHASNHGNQEGHAPATKNPTTSRNEVDMVEYPHEYLNVLRDARDVELRGDLLYAIHLYMNALEMCDEDINLHCKINYLANALRFNDTYQ
ncbi:hypothetical protein C9374_000084 [Naegleria lovaniensis]|uniref:Uncharacterized protein n=1 Tax=Naegleria lovaniensis TaxID=51637 RepID=A0AA88KM74_NAELO|nr:uncharacterized protein C9374_000084 [Naegleria lovaniensis]KAG2388645.1 hypothetical protein C9374_000084 [Naegleria lovaniensis]